MNSIYNHSIDIIVIIVYVILCVAIGFYKVGKIKNIKEYTLTNQKIPIFFLAATIFATSISASSGIDKVGNIYNQGLVYAIPSLFLFLYWFITSKIFASRIYKFSDCISLSEVMERLYGRSALYATNFSVLLDSIGFISIQIAGMGYLFKYFFQIDYTYGATLGFIVFTTYSIFGGIRAVILTDVMQFLIFFIVFPMGCGILFNEVGGYKVIVNQINQSYSEINNEKFLEFLSYLFYCLMPTVAAPNIQRMLIAKDKRELTKVFLLVALMALVFNITLILISLTLKIKNASIESKEVLYYFVYHYLPSGIMGCMVAGMLAIMMSTADSWLNVASSTLAHDVIKKGFKKISVKQEVLTARIATLFIGLTAYIIALKFKKISDLIWIIRSFVQPVVFVPFLAGLYGFKARNNTFIVSGIIGIMSVLLVKIITGHTGLISLMTGTVSSLIGFFSYHYLGSIDKIKRLSIKKLNFLNIKISYILQNLISYCKIKNQFLQRNQFYVLLFLGIYILSNVIITAINFKNYNFSENKLIYIRSSFTLLCICAFLLSYWGRNIYKYIIFYIVMSSSLLFFALLGVIISQDKIPWIFNIFISVFILYWFSKRYFDFIINLLLGVIFFIIVKKFNEFEYASNIGYYHLCSLCVFLIFAIFFERREKNINMELVKRISVTVAHDLKNPISIIKTHLYSLKQQNYEDGELIKILNKIGLQANKSLAFIENSMSTLREQYKLNLESFFIDEVIYKTIDEFDSCKLKNIKIEIKVNSKFRVKADKILLMRTLTNLLNNACEALTQSCNKLIQIEADIIDNYPTLIVKDYGTGIKKEIIQHIFEPSFTKRKKGTGFGLAFCKSALEIMNIEINCKSIYGEYTEFIIQFT